MRAELTLPVHMSLKDLAGQLNPGGVAAAVAEGEAEWAAREASAAPAVPAAAAVEPRRAAGERDRTSTTSSGRARGRRAPHHRSPAPDRPDGAAAASRAVPVNRAPRAGARAGGQPAGPRRPARRRRPPAPTRHPARGSRRLRGHAAPDEATRAYRAVGAGPAAAAPSAPGAARQAPPAPQSRRPRPATAAPPAPPGPTEGATHRGGRPRLSVAPRPATPFPAPRPRRPRRSAGRSAADRRAAAAAVPAAAQPAAAPAARGFIDLATVRAAGEEAGLRLPPRSTPPRWRRSRPGATWCRPGRRGPARRRSPWPSRGQPPPPAAPPAPCS